VSATIPFWGDVITLTNVATLNLATCFSHFSLYCQQCKTNLDQEDTNPQLIANSAAVLIQDESEDQTTNPAYKVVAPKATSFDLDGPASNNPSLITSSITAQPMHATAHSQWGHPQNTGSLSSSCMLILPLWQSNQAPMVHQTQQQPIRRHYTYITR
jgi:hypothetical protein